MIRLLARLHVADARDDFFAVGAREVTGDADLSCGIGVADAAASGTDLASVAGRIGHVRPVPTTLRVDGAALGAQRRARVLLRLSLRSLAFVPVALGIAAGGLAGLRDPFALVLFVLHLEEDCNRRAELAA